MSSEDRMDGQFLEWLCKSATPIEFSVSIQNINYSHLTIVQRTIAEKISDIKSQIANRADSNIDWKKKAQIALSFNIQKSEILSSRIKHIRVNSISTILSKIDKTIKDVDEVKNKRLILIKCLLSIIERNVSIGDLSNEEKAIFDLASSISSDFLDKYNGSFTYDYGSNKIVSSKGVDIAFIIEDKYKQEEYGIMFANSPLVLSLLQSYYMLLSSMDDVIKGHPAEKEIISLNSQVSDLLSEH